MYKRSSTLASRPIPVDRQETMKRESMSFSTMHPSSRPQEENAGGAGDSKHKPFDMSQTLEKEMEAKFNLKNPVAARVGAQAAVKFMTGIKRKKGGQQEEKDQQGSGNIGSFAAAAAAAAATAVKARDGKGGDGGWGDGTGASDDHGQ